MTTNGNGHTAAPTWGFTTAQTERLLRPIHPGRVLRDQRGKSHLPAFDVTAHLTRIFGFAGWDKTILAIECIGEEGVERGGRIGWTVTYRCLMRLTLRDPAGNVVKVIEDGACGTAENQPSHGEAHDFAYKNAISYAIKRCAKDLGDQFGLSLYNGGMTDDLVRWTLVGRGSSPAGADVHAPEPVTMGNDESEPPAAPAGEAPRLAGSLVSVRRPPPAQPRRAG